MLITMLFCIGDLDSTIASTAPYLELFNNTGSGGVALMLSILIFLLIAFSNVNTLAIGGWGSLSKSVSERLTVVCAQLPNYRGKVQRDLLDTVGKPSP